ncbi:uncharacterized protein LTR77_007167 [Saxophila tyrrhenica]|uniref:Uncharacterized protein n=1 Tax=Saxophila tyrrhenica TaxID=1690608 RepID=A0AAV9P3X1_9PEZI|nr:hypothetical protein LTR77_007167 [Saxophila tyrrhenica]
MTSWPEKHVEDGMSIKQSSAKASSDHDEGTTDPDKTGAGDSNDSHNAHSSTNTNGMNQTNVKPSRLRRYLSLIAEQWFLLALALLIVVASQIQVPLSQQELKRTITS